MLFRLPYSHVTQRNKSKLQYLKIFKYRGEWEFQQRSSFNSLREIHLLANVCTSVSHYQDLITSTCYTLLYSPIAFFTTVVWDSTTDQTNITDSSTVRNWSSYIFLMCTRSRKLLTLNLRFCSYIKEIEKWIIRQEPTERLAAPTALTQNSIKCFRNYRQVISRTVFFAVRRYLTVDKTER